ncbi:MAG: RIP metalloprotease RseP [Deltaproteobacteria bacterium]|nr:RIP metalloprotease RseP [Deltaproteobacteria bacterium]
MMTTIISFILVLGLLILVHELGHFLVAKKLDVKVEKFSIGFGPKLFAFTRGETEYMVSAFPLGGYVKMKGEEPGEALENDPREFASKPVGQRMAIIIAGPLMNLILTFLLLPLVFMMGVNIPAYLKEEVQIGWVMDDSPAMDAGIEPGDIIRKIDGEEVATWEKAITIITSSPGNKLSVDIVRNGLPRRVDLVPHTQKNNGAGYAGILHPMEARAAEISPGLPAEKAGFVKGDLITAINGRQVRHWIEMSNIIQELGEKEAIISLARDGKSLELKLKPVIDEASKRAIIGISRSEQMRMVKYGFSGAIKEGMNKAVELTSLTLDILKKLFTFNLSIKSLGGPIMIAQATGAAAESGLSELIYLMAFISLQLGVLNLLPIPVLDGGHVFFLLAELALRKPVSTKAREIAQQVGFAILITLMLIVSYNDVMRAISF